MDSIASPQQSGAFGVGVSLGTWVTLSTSLSLFLSVSLSLSCGVGVQVLEAGFRCFRVSGLTARLSIP